MDRWVPWSVARSVVTPVWRPTAAVLTRLSATADTAVTRLVAEVARRIDVDAVVARVDVDGVVRRADLAAILDRLDLTAIVLERVDLGRVVDEILAQLDEARLRRVLGQVDLDEVVDRVDVDAVLDRVDLTAVVLDRVDLRALVDATLAHVDLVGLAEEVIDGVDLPEIIRESTGSMASDTVKGIRMQGIDADRAVARAVDRLLLRHERPGDELRS